MAVSLTRAASLAQVLVMTVLPLKVKNQRQKTQVTSVQSAKKELCWRGPESMGSFMDVQPIQGARL